jgi:hypothetical protein
LCGTYTDVQYVGKLNSMYDAEPLGAVSPHELWFCIICIESASLRNFMMKLREREQHEP